MEAQAPRGTARGASFFHCQFRLGMKELCSFRKERAVPRIYRKPRRGWRTVLLACACVACGRTVACAEPVFWDDGIGDNDKWKNARNWNPDGIPTATSDVTLGVFVETDRIDAVGTFIGVIPPFTFDDPALRANSLTIGTTHGFTVDGALNVAFIGSALTSLTLTSGNLTRQDVPGVEGDHVLALNVRLANNGTFDVHGSGALTVSLV